MQMSLWALWLSMGPFAKFIVILLLGMSMLSLGNAMMKWWRMRKAQGLSAPIADLLCEGGRFGQKTGRGFYLYTPGSHTPQPDPEVAMDDVGFRGGRIVARV